MKYLLATVCGAALTLCIFAGGAAFAITYLTADPVPVKKPSLDASLVFRADAVKVDPEQQDYQRIEARSVSKSEAMNTGALTGAVEIIPEIDQTTTTALPDADLLSSTGLSDEHVTWCRESYRSYQPESNSYTPYSGGGRECVSPYSESSSGEDQVVYLEASATETFADNPVTHGASAGDFSDEHIVSCFERYRSYRPDDNSYQPYSGGPRMQCE